MRKILLVEDSLELSSLVQRELLKEGYQVQAAASGQEALALFARFKPDLLLLDWMLPDISGLDVLRQVRAAAATPVLMLTARGEETDRVLGLELGADDYLVKPFGMRELLARVHALLRRLDHYQSILAADQQPASARLTYGPLSLDPETYLTCLDDQPVELTRMEFDLLSLLVRNPGRVFSRSYLSETVWEQPYLPGDRSVDNAILRLRKKIGPVSDDVETVWGVGYRLKKKA
jgi:DNA-binding response OmpR family regulator